MFNINNPRLMGKLEGMALFGEIDTENPKREDGYPNRIYDWVDRIPATKRVMVGHDIRSTILPLFVKGAVGGEAYFMDTGSGKGGRLTSADVYFDGPDQKIKNFKYH
jgi:protein phosphatase